MAALCPQLALELARRDRALEELDPHSPAVVCSNMNREMGT